MMRVQMLEASFLGTCQRRKMQDYRVESNSSKSFITNNSKICNSQPLMVDL